MTFTRATAAALERRAAAVPAASGAVVMGTGIVSIALARDGVNPLSDALLAVAAAVWVGLAVMLVLQLARRRAHFAHEARSPAALTGVAGTAVLGAGFATAGANAVGIALLALATAWWAALLVPVLAHWTTPTVGVSFLVVVATEALAALAATIGATEGAAWLVVAALAAFALGLALYVFVLVHFDRRQLVAGRGDHWVTGGALAIAALAAGTISDSAVGIGDLSVLHRPLELVALAVWALALAWLPILVVAELAARRPSYHLQRWATVFPLGMYAACSFVVGGVAGVRGIVDFADVWTWVAFAAWLASFAAMTRRVRRASRGSRRSFRPARGDRSRPRAGSP